MRVLEELAFDQAKLDFDERGVYMGAERMSGGGAFAKAEEFAAQAEAVLSNLNKASEAPAAQTSEESAAG